MYVEVKKEFCGKRRIGYFFGCFGGEKDSYWGGVG